MKKNAGINLAILVLSSIIVFALGFGYVQLNNNKIAKNTYIQEINLGDLTKEQAKEEIKDKCKIDEITLNYNNKKWIINPEDIDVEYDVESTVENAFNVNRNKNIFLNTIDMLKSTLGIENHINIVVKSNDGKIKSELEKISKEINVDMENAKLDMSNGSIQIIDEKTGIKLDVNSTLTNIKKSLQNGIYKESLAVTKVEPNISSKDLENVNTLLGSHKTVLHDISAGRVENIKLATQRTSGVLLMPGEEFSYNKHTGLRTVKNGYKNATVIVSGEAVQGVGGGVCQVSTTLYNSVLYAGLEIVKVSNHSLPSSYADKGRDATVSDSGLDFIFKNNYTHPVYIQNYYSNGTVTCQVYGNQSDKKNIEIVTKIDNVGSIPVKKQQDASLPKGKEKLLENGRNSYTVSTYRVYYDENGKEIKREKIATSYYPPKQKVIAIGTKEEKKDKEDNKKDDNKKENNDKKDDSKKDNDNTEKDNTNNKKEEVEDKKEENVESSNSSDE